MEAFYIGDINDSHPLFQASSQIEPTIEYNNQYVISQYDDDVVLMNTLPRFCLDEYQMCFPYIASFSCSFRKILHGIDAN